MNSINSHVNKIPPKVILYGGTGLAKMLRETIEHYNSKVVAVIDDTEDMEAPFEDVPLFHGWDRFKNDWLKNEDKNDIGFLIAIGNPHGRVRLKLHDKLLQEGLKPVTIAHHSAWIANNALIGIGSQIDAGAVIMAKTVIGKQCIIGPNTNISHETILEDAVDTTVGVTICGNCRIGVNAWICAGATIMPGLRVGEDAIVGAGSLVNKDVPSGLTVAGVPAKPLMG